MIPLKDDVPSSSFPFVTIGLIVLNALVFLYQASIGMGSERAAEAFIMEFGAVPCRVTGACAVPGDFPSPIATIFTSMFMHGGLFHIAGNMLYLWIFGDNVEDTLGHGRFLLFYLLSGVAAALAQIVMNPDSRVPMVGASGAVSGVLGAYLLLFPYARVLVLLIFGFWIVVQFLNGLITVSLAAGGAGGGTAWFAHIGGFLAGIVLLFLMRPRQTGRL
jgi:membrane associated rhomboid family serine protease